MKFNNKKPTILILSPHIDDIEFGVPFFYIRSLSLGYNVIEVIMTNSEFGTHEIEFKGARLSKIRFHELMKVNQLFTTYTTNVPELIRLNYIDGHLPVDIKAIDRISAIIRDKKPDIILAPDPWYTLDPHPDHLNTGKILFFALRNVEQNILPKKIYYFYTFNSNSHFKVHWKDKTILFKAYLLFKSQITPLEINYLKIVYLFLLFRRIFKFGGFTENFRQQTISNDKSDFPKKLNLLQRVKYHFFSIRSIPNIQKFHNLTPKEIGIE